MSTNQNQPPAIGPMTGEQLYERLKAITAFSLVTWDALRPEARHAYNQLAAELWPPAPPPEPTLRAWNINEAIDHCDYWFRLKGNQYFSRVVHVREIDNALEMSHGYWPTHAILLRDYECTIKPGGKIEPCGVMDGGDTQ